MATLSCPQSRLKAAAGHKWGVGGDFNAGVSFGNLLSPYFVSLDLPCPTSPRWSLENMSQSPRIKNIKVKQGFVAHFHWIALNLRIFFNTVQAGCVPLVDPGCVGDSCLKSHKYICSRGVYCQQFTIWHRFWFKLLNVASMMEDLFLRSITMCRANAICSAI